ncbi:hypothetical protein PGT21_008107 [Puccinia graminis f. sp. tritici]|uniref:Vacuolar protein sorting-associated protein n=1 Tax=Puccinia graminis f. sp. tritici TaxID=56615 RepID=A0A5B0NMS5_PUCGR|nr:hypothetical protein PGT21_008107 [Puccinia graminis f. sp. tritici]
MVLESVVSSVLNQVLSAYVENFNPKQLNVGIWGGDIKLKDLKLKKGALDKFRLPVDVLDGSISSLVLTVPWTALGSRPVKAVIENIYLLAVPRSENNFDSEEDEKRKQASKMEKLKNSELLLSPTAATTDNSEEANKNESFVAAMTNKILDNLQLRIKNVHIRYEDKLSVPGHPFSVGFTLAELSAVSTDENWQESFIVGSKTGVHKLTKLDSLAIYFNTDSISLASLDNPEEFQERFTNMIARTETSDSDAKPNVLPDHQYALKPVSGEGKLILRKHPTNELAKINCELTFEELAFLIDADQYRDALSCLDLFHFYTRHREYLRFRPSEQDMTDNKAKALWSFALAVTKHEVHQKAYKLSWDYLRQRRDDRKMYIGLFKAVQQGTLPEDTPELMELEQRLDYQDIRFYRSLARSEMRKERITAQKGEINTNAAATTGWMGWIWGGGQANTESGHDSGQTDGVLSEEEKKQLYDAIEWDERDAASSAIDLPRDAMLMNIRTELRTGSFTLRSGKSPGASTQGGSGHNIISLVFDGFSADTLQRTENMELSLSLAGLRVYDGTVKNSKHPQIVRVKEMRSRRPGGNRNSQALQSNPNATGDLQSKPTESDPFFFLKFEHKPLDDRADNAITLNMRHMEIVYHPNYLEDVTKFFRPPASQLESVGALIDVASSTLEGIRQDTRAGLEFALQTHKTVDIKVDMNAPIIIIPQDVTRHDCHHIILDVGHIAVSSNLMSQERLETIKAKQNRQYTNDDYAQLESMMYDQFHVELTDTQLLLDKSFEKCLVALDEPRGHEEAHLIERISMSFNVFNCMVDNAPNLTRFKVQGDLPELRVNFSDRKYNIVMSMIDVALPNFKDESETEKASENDKHKETALKAPINQNKLARKPKKQSFRMPAFFSHEASLTYDLGDEERPPHHVREVTNPGEDDEFFEAPDLSQAEQTVNFRQNNFQLQFTVGKLIVAISKTHPESGEESRLVDSVLEGFYFGLSLRNFDLVVEITLSSMYIADQVAQKTSHMYPAFKNLVTSEVLEDPQAEKKDLVKFKYTQVQTDHPEFMTLYEGIGKSVDADLSTINIVVTRPTILELFDWIMNTFTDTDSSPSASEGAQLPDRPALAVDQSASDSTLEKIRVKVRMRTIAFLFNDDGRRLATLSLSSADVSVLLNGPTMRINARLGNLTLEDDTVESNNAKFQRLVEIQGDDLANFQYETFLKGDSTYPGHDSMVYLRSGSIQFTVVESIWHRLLVFFSKFAQMKAVMDAASAAARQQANDLSQTTTKMHYDILIRTPIIIFPLDGNSTDSLIAYLGEINASNSFSGSGDELVTTTRAGLHNIRLTSELSHEGKSNTLEILGDVNIDLMMATFTLAERCRGSNPSPDSDIVAQMSDVKINLTQPQYFALLALASSIPKILDLSELNQDSTRPKPVSNPDSRLSHPNTKSEFSKPRLIEQSSQVSSSSTSKQAAVAVWVTMELAFTVTNVTLELFDATITPSETERNNSLAKFSLTGIRAFSNTKSDGSMKAEMLLKALRTIDTRAWKATKFREIVPVAEHDSDQLALSYKQTEAYSCVNLELDSPNLILSLDFLFAIQAFLTDSRSLVNPAATESPQDLSKSTPSGNQPTSTFHYSVNVIRPKLTIISDPEKSDSDSVHLIIDKFSVNQQQVLTAMVIDMCMSLGTMNDLQNDVKFLDACTMSFSLTDVPQDGHAQVSMHAHTTPLILRLSYRDFLLVYSVYCKALDFSQVDPSDKQTAQESGLENKDLLPRSPSVLSSSSPTPTHTPEKLSVLIDKIQVVLIGDLHEQPLLDFHTRNFELIASNWSHELSLDTSITFTINYYNLANSNWEPLMEAWPMSFQMARLGSPLQTALSLDSKERLELNLTATFIDIVMTGAEIWGREGESFLHRKRGVTAPYAIKNFTGYSLKIWAELDDGSHSGEDHVVEDGKELSWRFEDWKSTRENVSPSTQHTLGLVLQDAGWTSVGGISVVREGDEVYPLRPSIDKVTHRLLCHVEIIDNVKVVTFRSTFQVRNDTLFPIEMGIVNMSDTLIREPCRIAPNQSCSVPIQAAYHQKIKIRPASSKNSFAWSEKALGWTDLVKQPVRTITCAATNRQEPSHRFNATTIYDEEDSTVRYYPKITLYLRAPIEIENLLPFDINCTIHLDKNYSTLLKKGELFPVHIVNVMDLMLLGIEFKDEGMVGMRSQYAVVNTNNPEDVPLENRMSVTDEDGLALNLGLHYMRYPLSGGAFKVQLYSPYVVINKTGLDFSINSKPFIGKAKKVAGQNLCGNASRRKEPRPLLFSHLSDDKRNRAVIRVGDSNWSKGINFDVVGANQQVTMQTSTKTSEYRVGLTVSEGLGKYKLTKVVVIYPRFIIKNEADQPICLREDVSDQMSIVKPGKRALLSLFMRSTDPQLVVAFESPMGKRWSKPFRIQNVGKVYIRAQDPQNEETLVHAEILLQGPSIFIKLNVNPTQWPILFRNKSSSVLHFGQTVINSTSKDNLGVMKFYESQPNTETRYAWDDPAAGLQSLIRVVLFREAEGSSSKPLPPIILRDVHVLEVGQLEPVRTHRSGQKLAFDVVAEGQAQVLVISDYNEATNVWKVARKNTPGAPIQRSDSFSSLGDAVFEATTVEPITLVTASISLEGIGISIIDKRMRELVYASFRGIDITYEESQLQQDYGIVICWIQLDNQLNGALFPVLFRPTDLSADPKAVETRPNLQIKANVVKDDKHGVVYIKYATVLLQKMSLEMDESFVIALVGFTKFSGASWNREHVNQLIADPVGIPEPASEGGGLDLYFELLHLQPFAIVISFERQESVDATERTFDSRNPLYFLLNAVTMAIGTISGAPLMLNQLKIENARMSQNQLMARLIQHYQNEGLSQLYRVLASADFLGNPAGLFSNVSSGVQDLFYEPFNGVVLHGGSELGVGIARGATSLVKKSAFGVTDSVSKITGSVSKGLSAAALDSDWARERQRRQFRNRNKINGLATGTSAFLNSLASGIQGVAMKPIQGAENGGAVGFFKGVGKGLVGVVAKPAVGTFDFLSNVSGGLRNATTVFDPSRGGRCRLPRHISHDGILRPYSLREAQGQDWLRSADNGKLYSCKYVAHVELPNDQDSVCILTTDRIVMLQINKLVIIWQVLLSELKEVVSEPSGVRLILKDDYTKPLIALIDSSTRSWFGQHIFKLLKDYNDKKKRAAGGSRHGS